jgi:hypothetical protein
VLGSVGTTLPSKTGTCASHAHPSSNRCRSQYNVYYYLAKHEVEVLHSRLVVTAPLVPANWSFHIVRVPLQPLRQEGKESDL